MENNKKTYLTPILQLHFYEYEDIVTASNGDQLISDVDIKNFDFANFSA